ncbi:MAG: hypothetical protein KGI06_02130 [Candidatus Micrarchaeota archaeon]|nr:hypothetical protein [Candidatus Micrarchaeota archaeon]
MAQIYRVEFSKSKLSRREQLLMFEIDRDTIDTASSFVDYINEEYGFSKSSIWYCLNRLKDSGLLEFANKTEHGKPLCLTKQGLSQLGTIKGSRNEIVTEFSNSFLNNMRSGDDGRQASIVSNRISLYR